MSSVEKVIMPAISWMRLAGARREENEVGT
jgi:hypothetical protein